MQGTVNEVVDYQGLLEAFIARISPWHKHSASPSFTPWRRAQSFPLEGWQGVP